MNTVIYREETYRIVHAINAKTTICAAVIAKEDYASDIANYLSHGIDLQKIYKLTPHTVHGYEHIYNTYEIAVQSGVVVGYWDFPIPREYTLFRGRITNLQDNAREMRLMDFLYGQATSLIRHKMQPNNPELPERAKLAIHAFKEQDIGALESIFKLDVSACDLMHKLQNIAPETIQVKGFAAPRIQSIRKSSDAVDSMGTRNTEDTPRLNEIYDMGAAPWINTDGTVTAAGVEGICCFLLHMVHMQKPPEVPVQIKRFLEKLRKEVLRTARMRRGGQFKIRPLTILKHITLEISKKTQCGSHQINAKSVLGYLIYAIPKGAARLSMDELAPADPALIHRMQDYLSEGDIEGVGKGSLVTDMDVFTKEYMKFFDK